MELKDSKTKENLMRSFAGESQARNRYTIAAKTAKKQGMYVLHDLFIYTADQERAHAEVFYNFLKECNSDNIDICGGYPVNNYDDLAELLKAAAHGEYEEFSDVYPNFAKVAKEEGFAKIATAFENIAKIEKCHHDRFERYKNEIEADTYYKKDDITVWMCTNCGYIYEGKEPPAACPVCSKPKGYFIEFKHSEFE